MWQKSQRLSLQLIIARPVGQQRDAHMKAAEHYQAPSTSRPDWTFSVPAPRKYSPLWMLESLAILGVPIAAMVLVAAASAIGVLKLY